LDEIRGDDSFFVIVESGGYFRDDGTLAADDSDFIGRIVFGIFCWNYFFIIFAVVFVIIIGAVTGIWAAGVVG